MNLYAKLAIGAAAALAVVVLGARLLPSSEVNPGGSGTISSPEPTPTLAPSVVPSPPTLPRSGAIEPGTYLVTSYTETPFWITIPDGWTVELGMIATGDFYNTRTAVLLRPWVVTHVYADACQWRGALQPVGPTKADLVAALTAQTGREATGPEEVTLGGLEATRFVLSVPTAFDASGCDDGYLRPWPNTGGSEGVGPPMFSGSITTVYVVETDGKATAIQAARYETSPPGDVVKLEALLDSITFVP